MIAGGTRNYLHRADLRAVYKYYCRNHPRPDEPQYPLWMGLPAESRMTGKDLEARINECAGVKLPAAQRSEVQAKNLANILGVIRVPERTLVSHLSWASFMFCDLTQRVLGGKNPFSNRDVVYRGSDDDATLNKNVLRFSAAPEAVEALAKDSDMAGTIDLPVITMHAIDDSTAMVEYEAEYRRVVTNANRQDWLLQTFTREREHGKLSDAEYAALFETLDVWITSGKSPEVRQVDAACAENAKRFDGDCHFDPRFVPKALFTRVAPREGFKEVKTP